MARLCERHEIVNHSHEGQSKGNLIVPVVSICNGKCRGQIDQFCVLAKICQKVEE